ncbi:MULTISPECIES: hypothetical protein [unclassified Arthrobacter]|uniref:hypothetical protein n=1 Tax=unclassified Arthrobacter TaxID=235627 RepID=UPI0011B03B8A|nr:MULTISPECIES: hypothetical protein [unclassified Arthrobacter]
MPKNNSTHGSHKNRRIVAHGVLRETPDIRTLARAAIRLALADAQREAEAQQLTEQHPDTSRRIRPDRNQKRSREGDQS